MLNKQKKRKKKQDIYFNYLYDIFSKGNYNEIKNIDSYVKEAEKKLIQYYENDYLKYQCNKTMLKNSLNDISYYYNTYNITYLYDLKIKYENRVTTLQNEEKIKKEKIVIDANNFKQSYEKILKENDDIKILKEHLGLIPYKCYDRNITKVLYPLLEKFKKKIEMLHKRNKRY